MKICIRFLLIIISFSLSTLMMAANVLEVTKVKDKGSDIDHCLIGSILYQELLSLSQDSSNYLDLTLTINENDPSYKFRFPWVIQAFTSSGTSIATSSLIHATDFFSSGQSNTLRTAKSTIFLTPGGVTRAAMEEDAQDCLVNEDGREYSLLRLTFKIFRAGTSIEVDSTCNSFGGNSLNENSHIKKQEFQTCSCLYIRNSVNKIQNDPYIQRSSASIAQMNSFIAQSFSEKNLNTRTSNKNSSIHVYPNPANSYINIYSDVKGQSIRSVELFTMNGQAIYQIHLNDISNQASIDLLRIPNGTYILKILSNRNNHLSRLVINH